LPISDYDWIPELVSSDIDAKEITFLASHLIKLSKHWEKCLYTNDGALNLQKHFWYLMTCTWDKGLAKLTPQSKTPYNLFLMTGSNHNPPRSPMINPHLSARSVLPLTIQLYGQVSETWLACIISSKGRPHVL